jgi:serine/threonine protein kinase
LSPDVEKLLNLAARLSSEQRALADRTPGRVVGSWRLVSLIGRGGMGSVYLAERADGEIRQRVAVKFLRADGRRPEWRERFLRERQLQASLDHPAVAHVIDAGHTDDGRPFLVMEYVEGVPIDQHAARIGVRERLELFLRVCEGVSHAHRHLVIHRDLKPSNILVDTAGQPKLLDFGLARLLTGSADVTGTAERLLTPNYASPEQARGEAQSTATDIYSLGAVMYKLLTGVAPREAPRDSNGEPVPPSRLNGSVPGDIDFVAAKALRPEPDDRYVSVDEFAADVRAALEWRPVRARGANAWYRARRFMRRYWPALAAAFMAIISLATGLYAANRQRAIAARRFAEVRELANKLFDIEYETRKLPGSTKISQFIVDTSLEYLRRLAADARREPALSLEIGNAYMRVARVQGVPIVRNLGQMEQAEQNLRLAGQFIQSALAAQPANRTAMLRSAQIAHDRMLLARYNGHYDEALALARQSAVWLEKFNAGANDKADATAVLNTYLNVADQHARAEQLEEALRLARLGIELSTSLGRQDYVPDFLWILADVHRRRGELEQALEELDRSARLLDPGGGEAPEWRMLNLALALIQKGELLGEENGLSLGRPHEAVEALERAFRLGDESAHRDPYDQMARSRVANAGISLAAILRASDPARSLAVYDHTFRHVSEIQNNSSFRRFEVTVLAGASYALRKLGRPVEARQRLDGAFERLRQLNLYPASRISLGSEAEDSVRALAAYEAGAGHLPRAVELCRELLDRFQPAKSSPETSLTDAVRISTIYREAAEIEQRAGLAADAGALRARDRALWQHWDQALPNNAFIRRRLAGIGYESGAAVPAPATRPRPVHGDGAAAAEIAGAAFGVGWRQVSRPTPAAAGVSK